MVEDPDTTRIPSAVVVGVFMIAAAVYLLAKKSTDKLRKDG
jgi:hypothetical protein